MEQFKTGSKEPLMMSGPKFGESNGWLARFNKWMRRNSQQLVLLVIGILIVAGAIYLYSNYQKSNQTITLEEQSSDQQKEEETVKPEQINLDNKQEATSKTGSTAAAKTTIAKETTSQTSEKAELVKRENGKLTIKANKGAGVTHLGRQALKEYLDTRSDLKQKVTAEHKIYIEDYLKDKTGSNPLSIGQEITFSEDLINEAIDSSQKLSQKQLENLHKYVLLVPSLAG